MAKQLTQTTHRLKDWAYELPAPPALRSLWDVLRMAAHSFSEHRGAEMAGSLAYFTFLSLFPLVLGSIAVVGFFISSETAQQQVLQFLNEQVPASVSRSFLQDNIQAIAQARGTLGVVSIIALYFSGKVVFGSLQQIMDSIWQIKRLYPFWERQARQFAMSFAVTVVFAASIGVSALGAVLVAGIEVLGFYPAFPAAVLLTILPLVFSTLMFLLIYKFVPHVRTSWRDIVPAALLAGALFELSKGLFVWYVNQFASFDRLYGNISAVLVLLVWSYIGSFIMISCGELSHAIAVMREEGRWDFWRELKPARGGLRPKPADETDKPAMEEDESGGGSV